MDLSGTSENQGQGDLFGSPAAKPAYRPKPESVYRRIDSILAELRAEESTRDWPWGQASFFRMVFPNLTCWLPEDEAARFTSEFEAEMARLEAA